MEFMLKSFVIVITILIGPVNLVTGVIVLIDGIMKRKFSDIPQSILQIIIGIVVTRKIIEILFF